MTPSIRRKVFRVRDYDLEATLTSGQVFRWRQSDHSWLGVVGDRWVKLTQCGDRIVAEVASPQSDWQWLVDYLQVGVNLDRVLATFPGDAPMQDAVQACRGLRLLRQDPWECLASFILSSTKQIVQIQKIVAMLCERFGVPIKVPAGEPGVFAFPAAQRLAELGERELRACKMGFRAPYLLATARRVAGGRIDLAQLQNLDSAQARERLLALPGVGGKIADCILLFAYGFPKAFPLDVWVMRAMRQLYFRNKRPTLAKLRQFAATHFGPNAGYAQQYLFHYFRTKRPNSIFTRGARL